MNLIPVVISLSIAVTSGLYYWKNNQDDSQAVQYRAVMLNVEQVASALGADLRYLKHESLNDEHAVGVQQCQDHDLYPRNLYIPPDIRWRIEVSGLDCDIAKLSIGVKEDRFPSVTQAAVESGVTIGEINNEMSEIHWLHRLYKRRAEDGGVKGVLSANRNDLCLRCVSERLTIKKIDGDNQFITVAQSALKDPLIKVFHTNDNNETGISGVSVVFEPVDGGNVSTTSVQTDANGLATTQWIMGERSDDYNLRAKIDQSFSYVVFTTTATPDDPASMDRGMWQTGLSGTAGELFIGERPSVRVIDQYMNPISGQEITFTVNQGGGSIDSANNQTKTVITNSEGIASVSWTLGQIAGPNTLIATHSSLGQLSFSVEGIAGPPFQLDLAIQPKANNISGEIMSDQPVVRIEDRFGNFVDNSRAEVSVAVMGEYDIHRGMLEGPLLLDAVNGVASYDSLAFEGLIGREYRLKFSSPNLHSAISDAIQVNQSGKPFNLIGDSGFPSHAEVGSILSSVVTLTDRPGNPIPNQPIDFAIYAGGGNAVAQIITDNQGLASASWTLGTQVGINTLKAKMNGCCSATLQTYTYAGPPAGFKIVQQPKAEGSRSGESLKKQPTLEITDQYGNSTDPSDLIVTATIEIIGDSGANETEIIDGDKVQSRNGSVEFTELAIKSKVGREFKIKFTFQTNEDIYILSDMLTIQNAGHPTGISIVQGRNATAERHHDADPYPIVMVHDDMDNPVSGADVRWRSTGSSHSLCPVASFNSDIYATPYVMKTDSRGEARVKWRLGADVCELMANFGGRIVYFRGESYKDNGDSW